VTSLDLQVERIGGAKGTLIAVTLFFVMSLVLWSMIIIRSKFIKIATADIYSQVYDGVLFDDDDTNDDQVEKTILGG